MSEFNGTVLAFSMVAFCAAATLTLLLCVMSAPDRDDLRDFYTSYGTLSPLQGGLAVAGDHIGAATAFGVCGLVALYGYDGTLLPLAGVVSLTLVMFLLAEPLRNTGRFTLGDVFARRAPSRAVGVTVALVTLAALLPMMVLQLACTGELMSFVLALNDDNAQTACVIGLGALVIAYAAVGGIRGTALVQVVKMTVLLGSGLLVSLFLLSRFGWSPTALFDAAARNSGLGHRFLSPGTQFAGHDHPGLDTVSLQASMVLGAGCLPHVTMRMFSARSTREVRRSMSWAVCAVALFSLILVVVAFGATALLSRKGVTAAGRQGTEAYLLAARAAFGSGATKGEALLLTTVTTAVFLTLLASVAGMILACANSIAHDLFPPRAKDRAARHEVRLARTCATVVGAVAIALAVLAQDHNLAPLATLAFGVGASALAPALIYSLFWRRCTRAGLLCTLIGGTLTVLALTPFTDLVSGYPTSMLPDRHFDWFPFATTGIVSIPAGFLLGWLGTVLSGRRRRDEEFRRYEALEDLVLAGRGDGTGGGTGGGTSLADASRAMS